MSIFEMISKVPISLEKIGKEEVDKEALRVAIIAELDAINLYEQLAQAATNSSIRRVLLEIAREEKTHVGELQTLLLRIDKEQASELEKGRKEVEELTKK
jgi:rubrerythrin